MVGMTPLTTIRQGSRVRIASVNAGRGLQSRLCAMGLTPGTPVEVISMTGGPVILEVMGSRLMLGRGMASKVFVRPT